MLLRPVRIAAGLARRECIAANDGRMTDWDPELYNRFQRYRSEPAEMLIAQLAIGGAESIVDFGCGTGENTVALAERTPNGFALGIDSSPEMLARAAEHAGSGLYFERGDLGTFEGGHYDLVFSNAAVQWASICAGLILPHSRSLSGRSFATRSFTSCNAAASNRFFMR